MLGLYFRSTAILLNLGKVAYIDTTTIKGPKNQGRAITNVSSKFRLIRPNKLRVCFKIALVKKSNDSKTAKLAKLCTLYKMESLLALTKSILKKLDILFQI
jgi:hypothetical protein